MRPVHRASRVPREARVHGNWLNAGPPRHTRRWRRSVAHCVTCPEKVWVAGRSAAALSCTTAAAIVLSPFGFVAGSPLPCRWTGRFRGEVGGRMSEGGASEAEARALAAAIRSLLA
jgi:hypothetical protein